MWDKLFSSVDLLQQGLNASWTRNAVIRNNIANAETPDFKSSDVQFESIFASSLNSSDFAGKKTRDKHIDIGASIDTADIEAKVVLNEDTSMLFNGNNVDIEAENVKLAQNSIYYNTLQTKLNGELARLKMAIREGK